MKKLLTYCIVLISILLGSNSLYSQNSGGDTVQVDSGIIIYNQYNLPKPGTYEIFYDNKTEIVFTKEVMERIEQNRHATEEKIIYLGYNTTVRILPRSVIEREDFVPIPER